MSPDGDPPTLRIGDDWYDRDERLDGHGDVGHGYARRAEAGGQQLHVRVVPIACPGCGRPLHLAQESPAKLYRCGTADCRRTFRLAVVQESGRTPMLALVSDRF